MNECLRNNQTVLRGCILYEFAEGKTVYKSYKNMCRKIGDDLINYVDFEYWFMRFANGMFDLNHDRSLDPKTRTLSDMPVHILDKIVNELDLEYRFVIRRVSKNFQYVIDGWYPEFKNVSIDIDVKRTQLHFSGKEVPNNDEESYDNDNSDDSSVYSYNPTKKENDCVVTYGNKRALIETEEHAKLAIEDLAVILKNSKLQLDELKVLRLDKKFYPEFESMLKSLNRKIHAKKFSFIAKLRDINGAMTILPYLKAGTLEEIVLDIAYEYRFQKLEDDEFNTLIGPLSELVKHCKNAKMLTLTGYIPSNPFPIESFIECRRFTIDFNWVVQQKTALRFTKILLKSTVLEIATLKPGRINIPAFLKQLGKRAIGVPDRPNVRRLPIPKSEEFFEIKIDDDSIRIERTS